MSQSKQQQQQQQQNTGRFENLREKYNVIQGRIKEDYAKYGEQKLLKISNKFNFRYFYFIGVLIFKLDKKESIVLIALGNVIEKALIVASLIQSRIENLHSIINISTSEAEDTYEPKEHDLDQITKKRYIPKIEITLTTNPTNEDKKQPGYQKPDNKQFKQVTEEDIITFKKQISKEKRQVEEGRFNGRRGGRGGGFRGFRGGNRGFRGFRGGNRGFRGGRSRGGFRGEGRSHSPREDNRSRSPRDEGRQGGDNFREGNRRIRGGERRDNPRNFQQEGENRQRRGGYRQGNNNNGNNDSNEQQRPRRNDERNNDRNNRGERNDRVDRNYKNDRNDNNRNN